MIGELDRIRIREELEDGHRIDPDVWRAVLGDLDELHRFAGAMSAPIRLANGLICPLCSRRPPAHGSGCPAGAYLEALASGIEEDLA